MKRNNKITYKIFFSLILFMVCLPLAQVDAAMSNYCVTPPFIAQSIPPNVLVILDNSGSMNCLAYLSSYDPSQFTTGYYYGYFDPTKNYRYDTVVSPNRWIPTTNAITTGTATNPIASGNLLNWITMSRRDVAKRVLIGGRASSGTYAAADRTTNPVKLYGNSDAVSTWTCAGNSKSYDSTTSNLIYPFAGDYKYTVATGHAETFSLSFNDLSSVKLYPTSNYPGSNPVYTFPATWLRSPSSTTLANAYILVDETTANTTDYISNQTGVAGAPTDQALFDYNHADATLVASSGTITSITIHAYAKKTGTTATVKLQAVLWLAVPGPDMVQPSGAVALTTSFADIPFTYSTNPSTGMPWQWSDFTSTVGLNRLKAFGVQAVGSSALSGSLYPTVSQVYIEINVSSPASGGPYKIIVDQGTKPASGIIDSMSSDVRFGLATYNSSEGGYISDYVDFGAISSMVGSISDMVGTGYTPLAETFYETMKYFRQDSTYYSSSDYIKGCSGAANGTSTCAATSTPTSKDPFFFDFTDASLSDKYVPCVKSFVILMTDGEATEDKNIPGSSTSAPYSACTDTNLKACSGRLCNSITGVCTTKNPRYGGTTVGQTYSTNGSDYLIDVAFWAHTNDMRPGTETDVPTKWRQSLPGKQTVTLYNVYLFGKGSTFLKDASIYGGFNDLNGNNIPDCTTTPTECYRDTNKNGSISGTAGICSNNPGTSCTTDANCTPGECVFDDPITYFEGDDGYQLEENISNALSDILRRVTSGTAASVLASGEGSGANLIQATYYPKRTFGSDEINWIGSLQNLWYYVDPRFTLSNIREEGGVTEDHILNLLADGSSDTKKDYILQLYYDDTDKKAKARRFPDPAGNGVAGAQLDTIDFENVGNLWNAGVLLWSRDLASNPRTIKTWFDKNSNGVVDPGEFIDFSTTAYNALPAGDKTTLRTTLQAADDNEASKTISYINGYDKFCTGTVTPCIQDSTCISPALCSSTSGSDYRSRTVAYDLNGDGDTTDAGESAKVWKLGDIINSTPQIASWMQLNGYDKYYEDSSYTSFVNDTGSTLSANSTARYKNRGMVFVGANDGMLHAFKLGKLGLHWTSQTSTQKATLGKYCIDSPSTACVIDSDCPSGSCTTDTDLGTEVWAFVPKNVLPYLKYINDTSYCHVYSVDLAPYIFDASIEGPATTCASTNYWDCPKNANSWRTILIGGMRYGGACKAKDANCATNSPNGVCAPTIVGGASVGYSSYFALDITDPYNPQLLWEFSNPDLGFASSGGVVTRISSRTAAGSSSSADNPKTTDGRWFIVFGSGPTGGISLSDKQFLGNSDQNLRLFILDLKTGSLVRKIDTGIANAFAGSLFNAAQDVDLDYQDDVVYIPYVRKCVAGDTPAICDSAAAKWNNGGVLRLLTNEDLAGNIVGISGNTALNPANWQYSRVIDDVGPVTSSVVRIQDKRTGKLWLYFGTGRYFYKLSGSMDDSDKVRHLYGLKDPCFDSGSFTTSCLAGIGASYTVSQLASVDTTTTGGVSDNEGWKIALDDCSTLAGTVVACSNTSAYFMTERVITNPLTSLTGLVFFTTLKPFDDICTSGGHTAIWALKYDTGGAPGTLLQGKALIQVSTGAIEQKDLSTAFTEKSGRKTADIQGVPPTSQGLSLMTQPSPVKRVIHMRER